MITREMTDLKGSDFYAGEDILIDKPVLWSSFKVVHEIRREIGRDLKIGHAGTLDPFATGLLILCTGKRTKSITSFQDLEKTYTGVITLGKSSPSMDLETPISVEKPFEHITEGDILKFRDTFTGIQMQVPPMYSAVKFQGKALYKYARNGKEVERQPKSINITEFEIMKIDLPEVHFRIKCSKGTYIRVIANDLGEKLGCGGVLSSLRRTAIGNFNVENALKVEEFKHLYRTAFAAISQ